MTNPFMLKATHEDAVLDLECELVCTKKKLKYQEETNAGLRRLVDLLLEDNKVLQEKHQAALYDKDQTAIDLMRCQDEIKELRLKIGSIEARWGKEATI